MAQLVLVRHGQSVWNLENRFTGWVDVDLSSQGISEAEKAGRELKNIRFNEAFTSELVRAQHTLEIILRIIGQATIPVTKDKALNERNYGDLQGLNKADMVARYGAEQVNQWRRSFRAVPPGGESLKDTYERVIRFFEQQIKPRLAGDTHVLVVAHGNSLRALEMYLNHLTEEEVEKLEIPTGVPQYFSF